MAEEYKMDSNSDLSSQNVEELGDDPNADIIFSKRGCCFWIPCFPSNRSSPAGSGSVWWGRISPAEKNEERWWQKGWNVLKKVREWSEIVAGPRWKTFIRRFRKNGRGGKQGKFQYDPFSYALNFDEGHGQNGDVDPEYDRYRDFSTRYAVPPSAKASMDLGKDGPDFTTSGR